MQEFVSDVGHGCYAMRMVQGVDNPLVPWNSTRGLVLACQLGGVGGWQLRYSRGASGDNDNFACTLACVMPCIRGTSPWVLQACKSKFVAGDRCCRRPEGFRGDSERFVGVRPGCGPFSDPRGENEDHLWLRVTGVAYRPIPCCTETQSAL